MIFRILFIFAAFFPFCGRADSIPRDVGALPLLVRGGIDDFGVTVDEFASCMSLAEFPYSSAPRPVEVSRYNDGNGITLTAELSRSYSFDIAVFPSGAIVSAIRSGLEVSTGVGDKMMIVGLFLERCRTSGERCEDLSGEVPCGLQGKIDKDQWRNIESAMYFAITMPPKTAVKWSPKDNLHVLMLEALADGCFSMALQTSSTDLQFEWCPER